MPPPRKPSHLRAVEGNPSHARPVNKEEPMPDKGHKPAPEYFSERAVTWYNELVGDLEKMGVMTKVDSMAAEMLIVAYEEYRLLSDVIDKEGFTYWAQSATGGDLLKGNPAVNQRSNAWSRIRGMLQEFGLTPASRSKVSAKQADNDNVLDDLMNRKRK